MLPGSSFDDDMFSISLSQNPSNNPTRTVHHVMQFIPSPPLPHEPLTYLHRIIKMAYVYLIRMAEKLSAIRSSVCHARLRSALR
jgi:hypothetical protein